MRDLVSFLCSPACEGRRPGTPGGLAARRAVVEALRNAGLDPHEQPVPGCGGANVLATIPGTIDRWLVVAAHYDHLGRDGDRVFWGADDNAAAVAVLVEVARALASERTGRGVIVAAFDGEEPPFFLTERMGSQHFVLHPPVPRETIDFMVCMDLVGHRIGPPGLPDEVGLSLFALGGERSSGTEAVVRRMARAEPGVIVRAVDAEIIPPLSDHAAFWRANIPFLFLSAGRSRVYHTPDDTPEKLDFPKMEATARWLARFVRESRVRNERISFLPDGNADATTLGEIEDVLRSLAAVTREAEMGLDHVRVLRSQCDAGGRLPGSRRGEIAQLIEQVEARLA